MNFKYAFVREPGNAYQGCITSHPLRDTIDINIARKQHAIYCHTLKELGVELINLPRLNEFPDSCFIEDTAIICNEKAFITRMGAISRRGEVYSVESKLAEYMEVGMAKVPATIEGGDVIHLKERLISGITKRTNQEGVNQMSKYLNVKVDTCFDPKIVHLKSYVTYVGKNTIICTKQYSTHEIFRGFQKIIVENEESWVTNTLTIGDTVLIAQGLEKIQLCIKELGFDVILLDISEFQKCEGAITCLSLLF